MTLEKFEEAKKLREEIGKRNSLLAALFENAFCLVIDNGFEIRINQNNSLHGKIVGIYRQELEELENRFNEL